MGTQVVACSKRELELGDALRDIITGSVLSRGASSLEAEVEPLSLQAQEQRLLDMLTGRWRWKRVVGKEFRFCTGGAWCAGVGCVSQALEWYRRSPRHARLCL
jgi:hypothetical protein